MNILSLEAYRGEFFQIIQQTPYSQIGVMTLKPGDDSGPTEQHPGDQILYVASGAIDLELAGDTRAMTAGMVTTIPAHAKHHLTNRGNESALLLSVYAPPAY